MSGKYELMIVATTSGSESLVSRVEKFVKDAEGLNLKTDKLGKKQLAYTIKKQKEAEYFLLEFEAEGANLKGITDKLRLEQEDLLRYMLLGKREAKPSKKKGKKVEVAGKEEPKKETAKVTVVTKGVEKESKGRRIRVSGKKPSLAKVLEGKVDAKAKSKVASKAKKK